MIARQFKNVVSADINCEIDGNNHSSQESTHWKFCLTSNEVRCGLKIEIVSLFNALISKKCSNHNQIDYYSTKIKFIPSFSWGKVR